MLLRDASLDRGVVSLCVPGRNSWELESHMKAISHMKRIEEDTARWLHDMSGTSEATICQGRLSVPRFVGVT